MSTQYAVNDNLDPVSDRSIDGDTAFEANAGPAEQAVIGAAILAVTAFRLRDEEALVATMRKLANAVANLNGSSAA